MNSQRRATLDQVAVAAGVGRGTVSRVIKGSNTVSPQARAAVLRAVGDLDYRPNRATRPAHETSTGTIALVVFASQARVFGDPFFGQLVRGVSNAVEGTSRQLIVSIGRTGGDRGRLEDYLNQQHVDGALLISVHGDDRLPHLLACREMPAVLGGRPAAPVPVPFVDVDNAGGARAAVAHLIAGGRRRIATVTGPQDMAAGVGRLAGYYSALAAAGLPVDQSLVEFGDFSGSSGIRAVRELLTRAPDLDAVFAASDQCAGGVLGALAATGRRVPDDVAVIGFDDSPISAHLSPALTTVHQPVEAMGARMVAMLGDLIDGRLVEGVILPTRLVVRASA